MIYINARCKRILSMLMSGKNFLQVSQIASETGVSRRSIYYDLCKINEWLVYYGIPEIEVIRSKGIYITEENKRRIEGITENEHSEEQYVFSPSERVKIIYCYIMITHLSEHVYIEQLSEYCQVSRNTIFNDLRVVVSQLQEYNLELVYESKKGYKISGDVVSIRALFFMYFSSLIPLLDSGVLNFLDREPIQVYQEKLEEIAKRLNTEYVDGVLFSLAVLVPLMYKGARRPYFPNLKKEKVTNTREYSLVREYFPDLSEPEQLYMCLHLLGSRVAVPADSMFENHADQSVYEITKALVDEFERCASVSFSNREELERALFVHINTSMYRYQYGIQIGNSLSADIIREYPNLFEITKQVSRYLQQQIGLPIPDSEIAYLALHFGSHLKIDSQNNRRLRILIVCVNGISTGNMLKHEIQKLLPEAEIVDVVAAKDNVNVQKSFDLVISTTQIKSYVPVLVVHPILTDFDRKIILKHQLVEKNRKLTESRGVFEVVKKYVAKEDYDNLKRDLREYLENDEDALEEISLPADSAGLLEMLKKDKIVITEEAFEWPEAISFAGKALVEAGSIETDYLENVISQVHEYGPCMFIARGLILAHAKPEAGVKRLDISMTVFHNPVSFEGAQEAKIIITLAAEDQEKHLKILRDIMTVFSQEDNVDRLAELESGSAILEAIEAIIRK